MVEELLLEDGPEQITSPLGLEITQKGRREKLQQKKIETNKKWEIFRNEINSIPFD